MTAVNPIKLIAKRMHNHAAHISTKIQRTRDAYVYRGYDLLTAPLNSWDGKYRGFISALRRTLAAMGSMSKLSGMQSHAPIQWQSIHNPEGLESWRYGRIQIQETYQRYTGTMGGKHTRIASYIGVLDNDNQWKAISEYPIAPDAHTAKRRFSLRRYIDIETALLAGDKIGVTKIIDAWINNTGG